MQKIQRNLPKKRPLELISKFVKVARYKINMHKSFVFLHNSNNQKFKFKNQFITALNNIKYFVINQTKYVQGPQTETTKHV